MQTVVHPVPQIRGTRFHYHVLFAAAYPLFLAAEALHRFATRALAESGLPRQAHSVFAEARENTLVAISYAAMARSTLRTSARTNRTERLS